MIGSTLKLYSPNPYIFNLKLRLKCSDSEFNLKWWQMYIHVSALAEVRCTNSELRTLELVRPLANLNSKICGMAISALMAGSSRGIEFNISSKVI